MTHTSSFTYQKAKRIFVSILTQNLEKSSTLFLIWNQVKKKILGNELVTTGALLFLTLIGALYFQTLDN